MSEDGDAGAAPTTAEPVDGQGEGPEGQGDDGRSVAEWTTLAVSVGVLLLLIGLVTDQYVAVARKPASLGTESRPGEVTRREDAFYLPVEVRNTRGQAAEDIRVLVTLVGSGSPETQQFSVESLAAGETAHGVVVLAQDPSRGALSVGITSFIRPRILNRLDRVRWETPASRVRAGRRRG